MSREVLRASHVTRNVRFDTLKNTGSVLDTIRVIACCDRAWALRLLAHIKDVFPDLSLQGDELDPVADVRTLVEVAYVCPGGQWNQPWHALCTALGGHPGIVDDVVSRYSGTVSEVL